MIRFSLLPRAYDAKFSLSSLTQSSMLISPLPPLLLGRYNRLPFYLECNPPYMVIIFLVFQSTFFSSSFVYSIMPGLYQTVGTSHVFITWNTCFAFNFYFNITLNLRFALNFLSLPEIYPLSPKYQGTYTLLLQSEQFLHHFVTLFFRLFFKGCQSHSGCSHRASGSP